MKIVTKRARKEKITRIIWLSIAGLLLTVVLLANQGRTRSLLSNSWQTLPNLVGLGGAAGELPVLTIDIGFTEYDQILDQRSEALSSGVVLLGDQDFVRADMTFDEVTVPITMRLQQGMVNHLGDEDKWNFEVRTRDDQLLSGMERFYLIDPSDNNWLNEYAFAGALSNEDLIAGRYEFVRLFMNGEYQGIYALQEGFGPQLLAANGRPAGVIVEFDTDPLWEAVAYFGGDYEDAIDDPVTNLGIADFQFFEVDTFRDAAIAEDPELTAQKNYAIGLLRGLQSGELTASEVFDVDKYGRFLALIDLWAATDGLALTNLRYYFNPETGLLEPVGFNTNPFGSPGRLPISATYHDPALQSAYLHAARRLSDPSYLAQYQEKLAEQLAAKRQAIAAEIDQPLPWDQLEERQVNMRRSLYPQQPVFAYLGSPTLAQEGIIQVDVANVINLPQEIIGFDIDGATFLEVDPNWITLAGDALIADGGERVILAPGGDNQSPTINYVRFHLPLSEILKQDNELDFMHEMDLQVATRILGIEDVYLTSARPGYPDRLSEPLPAVSNQEE